jgi:hypothetical protein
VKTNGFESNVKFVYGLCATGKRQAGGNLPIPHTRLEKTYNNILNNINKEHKISDGVKCNIGRAEQKVALDVI